ncbi:MAG: MBL fold metallo-hydrolase [Sedimentisphaerales bacterium]|nr:MBL fold metallo-hydrolase [Sedimentisphaerales bacterium]
MKTESMWRCATLAALVLVAARVAGAGASAEYVRIEKLSERVVLGYWLGTGRCNLLAIKSQKGLVIIDTEMSPRIMAPIKERLETALGRDDWAYVINTHAHMHHAGGNCLFKDAVVIGHENLADDMKWLVEKQVDEAWKRKELANNARTIRRLRGQLPQTSGNPMLTQRIQGEIEFFRLNTQDMREGFEIVKPTVTFSDKYTLDLGDVRLELVFFGKGHSLSDILIHIPQEGVLVTGAIVYQRGHLPGITERAELKDVHRYIAVLNALLQEGVRIDAVIASHSPPLTRGDLKLVRDYYQTMLDGMRAAQREGLTLEQAKDRFAVRRKFPHFWQPHAAQWAKAKQDRNITVLWNHLHSDSPKESDSRPDIELN